MNPENKKKLFRNYFKLEKLVDDYIKGSTDYPDFNPCRITKNNWVKRMGYFIEIDLRNDFKELDIWAPNVGSDYDISVLFKDKLSKVWEKTCEKNKTQLKEYYEPEKLYLREPLVRALLRKNQNNKYVAPKYIRDLIPNLPYLECYDDEGNQKICTKIPEIIDVYLKNLI
jgi:hypothetical protein